MTGFGVSIERFPAHMRSGSDTVAKGRLIAALQTLPVSDRPTVYVLPSFRAPGGKAERSHSNLLWATFDYTESRLAGRGRHVVGHHRLHQPFQA